MASAGFSDKQEHLMHQIAPKRSGFTLVELLVVLTMIGIVVTFALPRIDYTRMRVDSGYRQVGIKLLAAQRKAVLQQHAVVVAFDSVGGRLRLHDDRNNNGVIDSGEPIEYVMLEDGLVFGRGSTPAGPIGDAAITLNRKQGTLPAVTFHRSGSAGEFGGFYLTSGRSRASARYVEDTRAFDIDRATGRVSLLQYAGGRWIRRF